MNADYESWRPALIAFYRNESPWMVMKLERLERGEQLTLEDRRTIDALMAATEQLPERRAA